jgi:hypothetical protein
MPTSLPVTDDAQVQGEHRLDGDLSLYMSTYAACAGVPWEFDRDRWARFARVALSPRGECDLPSATDLIPMFVKYAQTALIAKAGDPGSPIRSDVERELDRAMDELLAVLLPADTVLDLPDSLGDLIPQIDECSILDERGSGFLSLIEDKWGSAPPDDQRALRVTFNQPSGFWERKVHQAWLDTPHDALCSKELDFHPFQLVMRTARSRMYFEKAIRAKLRQTAERWCSVRRRPSPREAIDKACQDLSWSLERLAEEAKVCLRTIHNIRKGRSCRSDTRRRVAEVLGMNPKDLRVVPPGEDSTEGER